MRQENRWKSVFIAIGLVAVLGVVFSPGHMVRAVTTISKIGVDIDGEALGDNLGTSVAMSTDGTRIAIGAWANSNEAGQVRVYTWDSNAWIQTGLDIDGEAAGDGSGLEGTIAMSADGTRIAIGAPYNDDNGIDAGHVRVYTLNNGVWTQTGTDIDGDGTGDLFGQSVAMSEDGNRITIGAPNKNGKGLVRVFTLTNGTWTQTGTDIDGQAAGDYLGYSVAMSEDGNRITIGAPRKNGETGQVRVYTLTNGTWTQTGTDIDGQAAGGNSGNSVAMSADGDRIIIGEPFNNGKGLVRVYTLTNGTWTQTGTDIEGQAAGDNLGYSVAMSADGNRIIIGEPWSDGNGAEAGQVRVYTLINGTWTQTGTSIDGEAAGDLSGYAVAMSKNGRHIAIGAIYNTNGAGNVRVYRISNTPAAPTISSITAANGSLTVAYIAGLNDGSPITNYKYSVDGINYVALNPATTNSPFTISGLTNGSTYSVTIKAVNEDGDSPASNALTGTPIAPMTPTTAPVATTTIDSLPATGDDSTNIVFISLFFVVGGIIFSRLRRFA